MFGSLGIPELMLIMLVALVVFGPRRLPEIGRTIGKALAEFRKATDELKNTIEREVRVDEFKQLSPTNIMAPLQAVSRIEPSHGPSTDPIGDPIDDPINVTAVETTEPGVAPAGADGHDRPVEAVGSLDTVQSQEAVVSQVDAGSHEHPDVVESAPSDPTLPRAE